MTDQLPLNRSIDVINESDNELDNDHALDNDDSDHNQQLDNQELDNQEPGDQTSQMEKVTEFYHNLVNSVYLPDFNFTAVLNGQFPLGYKMVSQIKWRWWLIMLTLAFLVFHVPYAAWALQRFINQFREVCQCDFIHLIRKSDMVEAWTIFWNTNKYKELKYLVCRSVCP